MDMNIVGFTFFQKPALQMLAGKCKLHFVYNKQKKPSGYHHFVLPSIPDQNLKTAAPCKGQTQGLPEVKLPPLHLLIWAGSATWPQHLGLLTSHMGRYLPSAGLGGPDMFLRPPLSTIKLIALPIHHPDWRCDCLATCLSPLHGKVLHAEEQQCGRVPLFFSFFFPFLWPESISVFILFVYKNSYRPSFELWAAPLSLSPSFCPETNTLSLHLQWRWINTFSFHTNAH